MKKYRDLIMDAGNDYSITFDDKPITVDQAKAIVQSGDFDSMNIAMQSFINYDYDVDALKAYYASN